MTYNLAVSYLTTGDIPSNNNHRGALRVASETIPMRNDGRERALLLSTQQEIEREQFERSTERQWNRRWNSSDHVLLYIVNVHRVPNLPFLMASSYLIHLITEMTCTAIGGRHCDACFVHASGSFVRNAF